jgi:hypothetical protein
VADLTGLPDFDAIVSPPHSVVNTLGDIIAPFDSGSYYVLPGQLQLATNPDGSPKFKLELMQYLGDVSASGQFAVLSFSLAGDFFLERALGAVRTATLSAAVKPVTIDSGFCRLYQTSTAVSLPGDLLIPTPLGSLSGDLASWTIRMSRDAGELIKGALQGQTSLLLGARVEAAVAGVAPRLPVFVQFDPTALLTALLARFPDRTMAVADVLAFFTAPVANYPLTLTAVPSGSEATLAQIMTDRVIAAYAALTPSPGINDTAFVRFLPMDQIETAITRWDLNEPTVVMRPWIYTLDPIGSMRVLNDPSLLANVLQEITIPTLSLGTRRIYVTASLPPSRVGIAATGVRLAMPSNPPTRFFPITETGTENSPIDVVSFGSSAPGSATTAGYVDLMLGATEPLQYTVTCFALIAAGEFVQEYESAPQPHNENWLQVAAGDFPLTFAYVIARSQLLQLATIKGTLMYKVGQHQVQQPFKLTACNGGEVEVSVAAPSVATGISIELQGVPLDGSSPIWLPATGPGRIELDVNSFTGYGPHAVTVRCNLGVGSTPVFIELISELEAGMPGALPGKIALTADLPSATWNYFASSPFHPGFCFRVAAAPGNAAAPWSAPCSPDTILRLDADGSVHPTLPTATLSESPTSSETAFSEVASLAH